jgi:hypothetical protein
MPKAKWRDCFPAWSNPRARRRPLDFAKLRRRLAQSIGRILNTDPDSGRLELANLIRASNRNELYHDPAYLAGVR